MNDTATKLPDDILDFDLTEIERRTLAGGLGGWGGPARCTDELALAMGFDGVHDLHASRRPLYDAVRAGKPLTRRDWLRVLLAAEIAFVSFLGVGSDWRFVVGTSEADALAALRSVQRKIVREVIPLVQYGYFGTRPPDLPI